eukprot:9008596-Alexandrium_andersonii.AAC.1
MHVPTAGLPLVRPTPHTLLAHLVAVSAWFLQRATRDGIGPFILGLPAGPVSSGWPALPSHLAVD